MTKGPSSPASRKLSDKHLQWRRDCGLCFKCDGKYSFGHQCPTKELQELEIRVTQEGRNHTDESFETATYDTPTDDIEAGAKIELSINFVVGFTSPHTMKVPSKVGTRDVVILIDSGATHNFILTKVVEELGLPLEKTAAMGW